MKKTIFKLVLGLTVLMFSCYLYTHIQRSDNNMTDLLSSNIEALASGEDEYVDVLCMGWGNVDCDGEWVEEKVINYSIR